MCYSVFMNTAWLCLLVYNSILRILNYMLTFYICAFGCCIYLKYIKGVTLHVLLGCLCSTRIKFKTFANTMFYLLNYTSLSPNIWIIYPVINTGCNLFGFRDYWFKCSVKITCYLVYRCIWLQFYNLGFASKP